MNKALLKKLPFAVSYYERSVVPRRKLQEFKKEFDKFAALAKKDKRFDVKWEERFPCLEDKTASTGFEPHYMYHPAWAARIIAANKPAEHVDISSTLYFSAMLSAFVPVKFYDYRPAKLKLKGLSMGAEDLTRLSFADNSIVSLSCMHVLEHVGLGRYGDPLDPSGDMKAAAELSRVLAKGGDLLFVTPVGRPRVEFNAHRVYAYRQVLEMFSGLQLKEFSLIPDDATENGMIVGASEKETDKQNWGCGCFWFKK